MPPPAVSATPAAVSEPAGPSFGYADLAALLRREAASTAAFHELQYRRVLKQPIERRGEFHFEPPSFFEKRVLSPVIETYRLQEETLSMTLPDRKTRQLSLRNQPLLAGLLLGLKAVVSGHLELLAGNFDAQVSGTPAAWRLDLKPSQPEVARYIEALHISGHGSEPSRFEIVEQGGDRTVTDIEPR